MNIGGADPTTKHRYAVIVTADATCDTHTPS